VCVAGWRTKYKAHIRCDWVASSFQNHSNQWWDHQWRLSTVCRMPIHHRNPNYLCLLLNWSETFLELLRLGQALRKKHLWTAETTFLNMKLKVTWEHTPAWDMSKFHLQPSQSPQPAHHNSIMNIISFSNCHICIHNLHMIFSLKVRAICYVMWMCPGTFTTSHNTLSLAAYHFFWAWLVFLCSCFFFIGDMSP